MFFEWNDFNFFKIQAQKNSPLSWAKKFFNSLFFLTGESQKHFKTYEKLLEDDKLNHVDENKRIDKKRFNSSNYGLEGSFKKLELD